MNNLQKNIIEIRQELSIPINKDEFLAKCALQKIRTRSLNYDKELDKYLKFLSVNEINSKDLTRMTSTISSLSLLISKSYDGLINMISKCDKNIFQNKD